MRRLRYCHRGLLLLVGGIIGCALPTPVSMAQVEPTTQSHLQVMFLFTPSDNQETHAVEPALIRAFRQQGYHVLDPDVVQQTRRREAEVLQLYEIEAAKQIGTRLGADIVVRGSARTHRQEKTYSTLGEKKITVSQATVSAKAILTRNGRVLVADSAQARKPFDMTGDVALETAADRLAQKLLQGLEQALHRDTLDYRLVVLDVSSSQSLALQEGLRQRVAGVQQVNEQAFINSTLKLDLSVEKRQDTAFKTSLFTGLTALGMGRFRTVARDGETIYLQSAGRRDVPISVPLERQNRPSPETDKPSQSRTESKPETVSPAPTATYQPGYHKSWAVVIGINNYQKWPKLAYAVRDAEEMLKRLKQLGFDEIIAILDEAATQQNILRVLGDELYEKTQNEDRVFIFFAGHGQTQDLPNGKMGYIIPVDGDKKNYYSTAISMLQLQAISDRLRAKHIFYAMDSCFSGLLLTIPRGGVEAAYQAQTSAPVRQVLTAGDEGEEVIETGGHGLFTSILLQGLDGEADDNKDGYVTAHELFDFANERVLRLSRKAQNPQFGRLGHGRGEFVFTVGR